MMSRSTEDEEAVSGVAKEAAGKETVSLPDTVREQLAALAEPSYAGFASGLLKKPGESGPTGSAARVLGVRLPVLRRLAKKMSGESWRFYLKALSVEKADDRTFEEIMLFGFLIGNAVVEKGSARCRQEVIVLTEQFSLIREFVPCIDNWSLCDSFCAGLKFAKEYPEETWQFLEPFLASEEEYAVRFALVMIINYFITDSYIDRLFPVFDGVCHEGYYVKMAKAWAVSICYVRFPEKTQWYLEHNRLDDVTYHKALQKIVESRCISEETRERIRKMKR